MSKRVGYGLDMTSRIFIILFLFNLATAMHLTGCSASEPKEAKPQELKSASSRAVQVPQDGLLEEAKRFYLSGLFSLAREKFLSLAESYPNGPYADFALLKSADSLYQQGDFEEATKEYESFCNNHPSSASLAYALYKAGRSAQLSSGGVGRDATPLERAKQFFSKLEKQFPDSLYAVLASREQLAVLKELAAHEHFVSDFYSQQDAESAADARATAAARFEREIVMTKRASSNEKTRLKSTTRPDSTDAIRASARYPSLSKKARLEAPKITQAIRINPVTQNKQLYNQPINTKNNPKFNDSQKIEITSELRDNEFIATDSQGSIIGKIECSDSPQKFIFLGTSKKISDESFLSLNRRIVGKNGLLTLSIPNVTTRPRTINCFGENDLIVSSDGLITLTGAKEALLMSVDSPPRLVISILR